MTTIDQGVMREKWTELLASLQQSAENRVFQDPRINSSPLDEAEGLRYLTRLFSAGALAEMEVHDPAYPQFWQVASGWFNYACLNPDCLYLCAYLHGDYSYRLFGNRGTANVFDVELWAGDQADIRATRNLGGGCDGKAGPQDFEFEANGDFEIFLSREKRDGNWLPIAEGLGYVCVRQLFHDWDNEQGAVVYIEREGAMYPPPPVTADDLAVRLKHLSDFVLLGTEAYQLGAAAHYELPINSFRFQPLVLGETERSEVGAGIAGQIDGSDSYYYRHLQMGQGLYQCQPDEAVILEVPAPESQHWNFYLLSHFWEGMAWNNRQSSLNSHQAVIDSDGMFRAVIAHRDPGVPNWLDTSNHTTGLICGRYYRPESMVTPQFRVVPFDELRDFLPVDTVAISPYERTEILRRRMHAVRRLQCMGY